MGLLTPNTTPAFIVLHLFFSLLLHVFTLFSSIIQAITGCNNASFICNVISSLSLYAERLECFFTNSSGKIPVTAPCTNSSSKMQIKASVLLWKSQKVHLWEFLKSRSSSGSELIFVLQKWWVEGGELFLEGKTFRVMSSRVHFSAYSSFMDELAVRVHLALD